MNWYKTIKIAASPKNIVNQWNVDDPYLKFFIYTYEPLIDLSKIKSKEELNAHIQNELIPSLKSKIDVKNPNGYYKKTMTDEEALAEINEHDADPRVQQAIQIFKKDPESAKKILLKATNDDKKMSFDRWWEYMSEYSDNPAFFYSMLSPMIESAPSGQKNGPPPANKKAIAAIKNEIGNKGVTQMNVFKKFVKNSFSMDKEDIVDGIINIDENKQWIRVDSKLKDPAKYKSNQEKLMRFATDSGWCIAQNHYSDQYLSIGDFWLYFENQRPKVAIRLTGNSAKGVNKVAEIRGVHNKEKTLEPYWETVLTFLHKTDFDYASNEHYKHLRTIMEKNVDLKKLETEDPEKFQKMYQTLLDSVKSDVKNYEQISSTNKKNYPEFAKTAAAGYEKKINSLLSAIENIPTTGNEYQNRFSKFQDGLNEIPEEVKPYMSINVKKRLVSVHKNAFMRNPLEYENFPEDMKSVITPEEQKEAWTNYVGQDPYRYNDSRIPVSVRKYIPLKPVLEGWKRLSDMNIDHIDNIPKFLLNITDKQGNRFFPENYKENKIIEDFKKYPCNVTSKGYDKLERIKKYNLLTDEQIIQVYSDFVSRNSNNTKMQNPLLHVPPQYRDSVQSVMPNLTSIADKYYQQVLSNASYFNPIDNPNIRNLLLNDMKYRNGIIFSFKKLQKDQYRDDLNGFWVDIPEDVKEIMPSDTKEAVANFWLPYVQKNPDLINQLDKFIKPIVENKMHNPPVVESCANNWYKKYIYAKFVGRYDTEDLIHKMKMLGIVYDGEGKGSHQAYKNLATGAITELPTGGKSDVDGETVKRHVIDYYDIPNAVWNKLPNRPKKKDILKIKHLLPWNVEPEEDVEEVVTPAYEEEPWMIQYKQKLEQEAKEERERKQKEEEENRLLEEMIRQEELSKLSPLISCSKDDWVKNAQKNIGIEDIIWAIDEIILKDGFITVEGLLAAEQRMGNYRTEISKAAQVRIPQPSAQNDQFGIVADLLSKGYGVSDIERMTKYPKDKIVEIKKSIWPNLNARQKYIDEKLSPDIVQTTNKLHNDSLSNFSMGKITIERISQEMGGVFPKQIEMTLKQNGLDISVLTKERQRKIEDAVVVIVKEINDSGQTFSTKTVIVEFQRKYNHNIPPSCMDRILKYNNLSTSHTVTSDVLIFTAFKKFLSQKGVEVHEVPKNSPLKIVRILDQFLEEKGPNFGYVEPLQKEQLKHRLMTKIQIRDRVTEQGQNRQWFKNFPFYRGNERRIKEIMDSGASVKALLKEFPNEDPSKIKKFYRAYYLQKRPLEYQEDNISPLFNREGSHSMSWYKKANKWKDKIPGGRADGKSPSDYNKTQVEKGKKIEIEHTKDQSVAKEIAIDHLEEHPDYYHNDKGLPAMENDLEDTKDARGLYNQLQGDEHNPNAGGELLSDWEFANREELNIMKAMAKQHRFENLRDYGEKLIQQGYKRMVVEKMMASAMHGVKL